MIQLFKVTLQGNEVGYGVIEEMFFFDDRVPNEQCDQDGNILPDPILQLDLEQGIVTEFTNPDEFGPARHKRHEIILSRAKIKEILKGPLEEPQIIFTILPNAFSIGS